MIEFASATVTWSSPSPVLSEVTSFTPWAKCVPSTAIVSLPKPVQTVIPGTKSPKWELNEIPAGAKPVMNVSPFAARFGSIARASVALFVISAAVSPVVEPSSLISSRWCPVPPSMLSVPRIPASVPVTKSAVWPGCTFASDET